MPEEQQETFSVRAAAGKEAYAESFATCRPAPACPPPCPCARMTSLVPRRVPWRRHHARRARADEEDLEAWQEAKDAKDTAAQ